MSDYNDNDDEYVIIKRVYGYTDNVFNVSVNFQTIISYYSVNQKWNDIVNVVEGSLGDYIDFMLFLNDDY